MTPRAGDGAMRPGEVDLDRLAALLEPLASPVRLRLLRLLATPKYLEEVSSELRLSRQAVRKHLDKLVALGVLEKRAAVRPDAGHVTEYVLRPQALFVVYDELEKLGSLPSPPRDEVLLRTLKAPGERSPPPAAGDPCLVVVRGPAARSRVGLPRRAGEEWTIGRDERCDLVLGHDPYASNRHADLRWDGQRHVLTDLKSTNGTEHNLAPVARGGSVALAHGDLVGVGKTLLVYWGGRLPPA